MPNAQSLSMTLLAILGFCVMLALGAFIGKKFSLGKLVMFAGVLALIAVVFFTVYSAYYFIVRAT